MKRVISACFFILMIVVFIFELYCAIFGAIDVKHTLAELEAREASGHEYLGVGADILVLGLIFIFIIGVLISLISWKIAQNRVVRTVSAVMCPLFLLPIFVCGVILTS